MSKRQTKNKEKNAKKLTEKALDRTVGGVDLASAVRSGTSTKISPTSSTPTATRPATRRR